MKENVFIYQLVNNNALLANEYVQLSCSLCWCWYLGVGVGVGIFRDIYCLELDHPHCISQ